jgi:hypothetical protein
MADRFVATVARGYGVKTSADSILKKVANLENSFFGFVDLDNSRRERRASLNDWSGGSLNCSTRRGSESCPPQFLDKFCLSLN